MSCQYSCQNRHVGDRLHNEDMSEKSRHSLAVKSDFLEEVHVRKVYEQIAPHICDLKQRTWPGVRDFLESLAPGSLVADVGCGSGRYLQVNPSVFKIGLDICHIFLESAVVQGFEVLSANNLSLPFRDGIFDGIISIGVLHHLASTERQVIAMQELSRVLSTGGRLMIYVWAFEQRFRRFESQDILVPWHPPHKTDRRQNKRSSSLTSSDTDRCSTSSAGSSISDDDSPSNTCCMQGYSNNMIDLLKSRVKLEGSFSEGTGQISDANVDLVKECQRVKSFLSHLSCKADAGHQPGVSSEVSNDAIFLHLKEASQDSDSILSEVSCDAKMSQSHEFPQGLDIVKEFSQLQASSLPSQQQISDLPSPALVSNMPCEHPVFRTLSQSHAFTTPSLVQPTGVLGTSQMSSIPSHIQVSSTSSQPKIHTVPDKLGTLHVLDKLQPIRIEYKSDSLSSEAESGSDKFVFPAAACTCQESCKLSTNQADNIEQILKQKGENHVHVYNLEQSKEVAVEHSVDRCEVLMNWFPPSDIDKDEHLSQSPKCISKVNNSHEDWCIMSAPVQVKTDSFRDSKAIKDKSVFGVSVRPGHANSPLNSLSVSTDDSAYHSSVESCSWQEDDVFLVVEDNIHIFENSQSFCPSPNSHHTMGEILPLIHAFKQGIKNMFSKSKSETSVKGASAQCFVPCVSRSVYSTFQVRKFPQSSLPQVNGGNETFQDDKYAKAEEWLVQDKDKSPPNLICQISDKQTDIDNTAITQNFPTQHMIVQSRQENKLARKCSNQFIPCADLPEISYSKSHIHHISGHKMTTSEASSKEKESRFSDFMPASVRKCDAVDTDLCRFYHVFREGELDSLITQHVPELKIIRSCYDHANWCLVVEKI